MVVTQENEHQAGGLNSMRPQANIHTAFTIAPSTQHTLASRASASLLVFVPLLMIATLIGPSAFLIAERAASTPQGLQSSVLVTTGSKQGPAISSGQALNHSPDRLDNAADKEGGKKSSSGKKRPRGALHSKDRISSAFASLVSYEGILSQDNDGDKAISTASTDPTPTINLLSPQLLQRPPPIAFL